MKALVTGATGFIGRQLIRELDRPVILSRSVAKGEAAFPQSKVFAWDPEQGPPPAEAFEGVDVVFHLAGEPVAEGRWNAAKKARIRDSRLRGTRNLVVGLERCTRRPPVLISASAVGFYGSRGDELLDESATAGNDFLAQVCQGWEAEAERAVSLGIRVANPRIGIVLGRQAGALAKILPLFRLGLGGRLASGQQWMPWVHVADLVGMLRFAAEHDTLHGPFNAVAPHPVTNREFTQALAKAVHRPALFPAPALGLRLAVGEFAGILLASQRVLPVAIERAGYRFQYPELPAALAEVVARGAPAHQATGAH